MLVNKEAKVSINEFGNLEITCQKDSIVLSDKGVAALVKTLNQWYGDAAYLTQDLES